MSTMDVAKKLVAYCKAWENRKAIEELYSDDAVSVEAMSPPDPSYGSKETVGKDAILKGSDLFMEITEVHGGEVSEPYPCDDKFIVFMSMDCTQKAGPMAGQRMQMKEACLYTVKNGKIVRSEFFYDMGDCG